MNQSRMKSILAVMEWIWALRQQEQSDEAIEIEINKKMRKSDFDKQQIKNMFINAQTVLKKRIIELNKQRMKLFQ